MLISKRKSNSIIQAMTNIKDKNSLNRCSKGICQKKKNQHSFMIKPQKNTYSKHLKTLLKLGIEGNVLCLMKDSENVIMVEL